ncbi:unnamed protein product [Effrenium voratum]|uniref:Resolvase/invertase-type recombinase catalytic domain-containing protein n=1 Tax=Effrenium voratum TaxID=2562239 RepID=A0AA36IAV0_9DINO|nr:unnamed protein product [Effrenium voratum]
MRGSNKKAPQLKASQARQLAAAKTAAGLAGKGAKVVKEVASGSRDVEKRQLLKAIQSGQFSHVYCESPRAVARNVMIQEMLYETSKAIGTQIVANDAPDLYKHDPSPAEAFIRRVLGATQQFDRDVVVDRLAKGRELALDHAKATGKARRSQKGSFKMCGRSSLVEERLRKKPLTSSEKKELRSLRKGVHENRISSRTLALRLVPIFGSPKQKKQKGKPPIAHTTALRIVNELTLKKVV